MGRHESNCKCKKGKTDICKYEQQLDNLEVKWDKGRFGEILRKWATLKMQSPYPREKTMIHISFGLSL